MDEERTVGQSMAEHVWTVHPKEAIESALRRLGREGVRSAIVTDRGVPVGVFDTVRVLETRIPRDAQVEDVMLRDVPNLTCEMTIDEASDRSAASGSDRLPVVDGDGKLIGEFTRQQNPTDTRFESAPETPARKSTPKVIDANDPASVLADAEPGMWAVAADGVRVGVVINVHIGDREDTWIEVEHGKLNRRRTIVDGSLVDLVDGNHVILSIDQPTFKMLPAR